MDQVRAKCVDIERAERAVRVELEQMSKKVKKKAPQCIPPKPDSQIA